MGKKRKTYSQEFKLMVVEDYLSGKSGGITKIAKKYDIPKDYMVTRWTRAYKEFGIDGLRENRGKTGISKGRLRINNISAEERILRLEAENANSRKIVEHKENILKKEIILELSNKYSISILLKVSKVSHSTYYAWLKRKDIITDKMNEDSYIISKIKDLYKKHKGKYGVDRMTHALEQDFGIKINRKRTYKLMKNNGYLAVIKAKKKYNKTGEVHPKHNVLKKNFTTSYPFDKIAKDITEIKNTFSRLKKL